MRVFDIGENEKFAIKIKLPPQFRGPGGNCEFLIVPYRIQVAKRDEGPNCVLLPVLHEYSSTLVLS